ncbi:unnamed protein product, partial [Timema podura]|nr:unnamed protein product [Timema podura]
MKLTLDCRESWVQCPTHLDISNISRGFIVKINPMHLPTGLHHTSIDAFDVACVNKGAVFRVPITVIRPQKISARLHRPELESLNTLFYPNYIRRNFVLVPENATWAVLKLHCREKDKSGRFVIHAVQLRPKLVCKTLEFHKICTVSSQNDVFQGFSVRVSI